jgi:transposase-like protein
MLNLESMETCPRCKSMSNVRDLSTGDFKCSSCGFSGNATTFRIHTQPEIIPTKDLFGNKLPTTDAEISAYNTLKGKIDFRL